MQQACGVDATRHTGLTGSATAAGASPGGPIPKSMACAGATNARCTASDLHKRKCQPLCVDAAVLVQQACGDDTTRHTRLTGSATAAGASPGGPIPQSMACAGATNARCTAS